MNISFISDHHIMREITQGISQGYTPTPGRSKPVEKVGEPSEVHIKISDQAKECQKQECEKESSLPGKELLTEDQKREVEQLKKIDRETKAHEQAHIAAGAGLVQGGASFTYQRGPDGRMYAVGGEVSIDTSPENDPDATIRKMQQVKRAALAPSHPSGQDRSVAAQATQTEQSARIEKSKQNQEDAGNMGHDESQPTAQDAAPFYENTAAPSEEKGLTLDLAV